MTRRSYLLPLSMEEVRSFELYPMQPTGTPYSYSALDYSFPSLVPQSDLASYHQDRGVSSDASKLFQLNV
jgi:hypothetical protein